MRTNRKIVQSNTTHEGEAAAVVLPEQQLRRSVLACLLWEDTFYEDGRDIAERIMEEAQRVSHTFLAELAVEARSKYHLRHVPLLLTVMLARLARGSSLVSDTVEQVIQRADELSEFLSIYAKVNAVPTDKLKPVLSNQVRKGLARAFSKFDAYALAKYDRSNTAIRLRDVMFLCHPRPRSEEQAQLWRQLIDGTLASPDTWEVRLSGGQNKREAFEGMLREGTLGYLALLRNLRNMTQAGCDPELVRKAIVARRNGAQRVLPFRYIAAARAAPEFEAELDVAMQAAILDLPLFTGRTVILVDVSGSMSGALSGRSDLTRMDAAAALAVLINTQWVRVFTFSNSVTEVVCDASMSGIRSIVNSQAHLGTNLRGAINWVNKQVEHDRLIVITDEQAGVFGHSHTTSLPKPVCEQAYMINVAPYCNGIGYGEWTHLDGFSEQVIRWMAENEAFNAKALS